ncbi:MAG: hypothetical protein IPP91_11210 [Betaproteobacteria bacterium]|nr:hypothetical protein [Betaproteobacteria bacterium]
MIPESMAIVVDAIGVSATISVIQVFSGTRLYVPMPENMGDEHPICRLLGRPLAEKLCSAVRGDYLAVPVFRPLIREELERDITGRARAGESYASIARSHRMSERAVSDVVKRARERA